MKTCACGRHYTAEEWKKLQLVGIWKSENLELRNCECGSTISIEIEPKKRDDDNE